MSVKINVKNNVLKQEEHYLTSDYKTRNKRVHNGVDLIGKNRGVDDVIAIDDGIVITSKYSTSAGNYVEIKHDNGYVTRYLHLKDKSVKVKKNERVVKGQIIGRMGNTGNSYGAHLHFAILNKNKKYVDPLPYLLGEKQFSKTFEESYWEFIGSLKEIFKLKTDASLEDILNETITVSSKKNKKHPVVLVIQKYLKSLGYLEVGNADGIAESKFTKAVKNYQKDNQLVVDGIITKSKRTWQKLLKLI